jgi:hypothetical protein
MVPEQSHKGGVAASAALAFVSLVYACSGYDEMGTCPVVDAAGSSASGGRVASAGRPATAGNPSATSGGGGGGKLGLMGMAGVVVATGPLAGSPSDGSSSTLGGATSGGKTGAGGIGGIASGGKSSSVGTTARGGTTNGGTTNGGTTNGGTTNGGTTNGGTTNGGTTNGGTSAAGVSGGGVAGNSSASVIMFAGNAGSGGAAGSAPAGGAAGSGTAGAGASGAAGTGGTAGATAQTAGTTAAAGVGGYSALQFASLEAVFKWAKGETVWSACLQCMQEKCESFNVDGTSADLLVANSCDAVTGQTAAGTVGAGQDKKQLCYDTLACLLTAQCLKSNSVQKCFCGTASGTACIQTPNGVCMDIEAAALEVPVQSTMDYSIAATGFEDLTRAAGPANALVRCIYAKPTAEQNCRDACNVQNAP